MCGREAPFLRNIKIEGTFLKVCPDCTRFGSSGGKLKEPSPHTPDVIEQRLERREKMIKGRDIFTEIEEDLQDNYPAIIRKARERLKLSQEDLAKKLNEKKSIISKLESGAMVPDNKLIKKLESLFGISLKKQIKTEKIVMSDRGQPLTIGDLIKAEMKKKE
jgi:putative transcription factor